jgi:hypothetical protein
MVVMIEVVMKVIMMVMEILSSVVSESSAAITCDTLCKNSVALANTKHQRTDSTIHSGPRTAVLKLVNAFIKEN